MLLINKASLLKLTLLVIFILTISHTVFAANLPTEIPPYINYQGTLTRVSDGIAANERLTMTFSLYTVPEGGDALYAQTKVVALSIRTVWSGNR